MLLQNLSHNLIGEDMKVLHIANIEENKANGVCVAVPQHVIAQAKYADAFFINLNNIAIPELKEYQVFVNKNTIIDYIFDKVGLLDVVIFHESNYISYISIYKKLVKHNIPYIILPHGEITQGALNKKWLKKKIAFALIFNKFIRNAIAIQCLSQNEADMIKIKTPKKFIGTNGVQIPNKLKEKFNTQCIKLFYIGRLDPYHKGLDILINALAAMKHEICEKNITLSLFGPNLDIYLEKLQEILNNSNMNDIVKIYPPVFGDEKLEVIENHDLFIQTSRFEGLPVGVIEVMGYGVPCVLSKGTNLGESLINNKCGYYAGESAEDVTTALKIALNDKSNWQEIGKRAHNFINENYNWDRIAENTINEYKKILFEEK